MSAHSELFYPCFSIFTIYVLPLFSFIKWVFRDGFSPSVPHLLVIIIIWETLCQFLLFTKSNSLRQPLRNKRHLEYQTKIKEGWLHLHMLITWYVYALVHAKRNNYLSSCVCLFLLRFQKLYCAPVETSVELVIEWLMISDLVHQSLYSILVHTIMRYIYIF